ncbi:hypothetical protein BKA66DRAFT_316019 [Pyrenochaeta sp. MPI-SDFR-AT-0127]|nr:hypothetical protein BKA66DRAFT_316019 [Pyrenochaeta sp. MPI-SDFR-AT-0127]
MPRGAADPWADPPQRPPILRNLFPLFGRHELMNASPSYPNVQFGRQVWPCVAPLAPPICLFQGCTEPGQPDRSMLADDPVVCWPPAPWAATPGRPCVCHAHKLLSNIANCRSRFEPLAGALWGAVLSLPRRQWRQGPDAKSRHDLYHCTKIRSLLALPKIDWPSPAVRCGTGANYQTPVCSDDCLATYSTSNMLTQALNRSSSFGRIGCPIMTPAHF